MKQTKLTSKWDDLGDMDAKTKESNKQEIEFILLVKRVFSSDDGRKLLNMLDQASVNAKLFHPDTNLQYARIGRYDLINDFKRCLQITEKQLTANITSLYDVLED